MKWGIGSNNWEINGGDANLVALLRSVLALVQHHTLKLIMSHKNPDQTILTLVGIGR